MPTCQHTMSVTRSGPLTSGPTSSPSSTSSQKRGSAPRLRAGSDAYASSISLSCSSVYGVIVVSSYLPRPSAFSRSVRIIRRYCAESTSSGAANTSAVHSCTARSANSLRLSCTPTSALRRVTGVPGRRGDHHSRKLPE